MKNNLPLKIFYPFNNENIGGSYTSMVNFAIGIKREMPELIDITFILPFKGLNSSLIESTGCKVKYLRIKKNRIERLIDESRETIKINKIFILLEFFSKSLFLFLSNKCEIIHVNDQYSLLIWGVIGKLFKRKIIWHARAETPGNHDRYLLKFADYVLSDAWKIKDRFCSINKRINFHAIHNVVDPKIFFPQVNKGALKIELGFKPDTILLCFVGNLVYRKRPEWAVQAANEIISKNKDVGLLVVGRDYSKNNAYTKTLVSLIDDSCTNKIKILGFRSDIPRLLQASDIFLLTSIQGGEAFPCSIIEAMACGLPIVSTNVAGVGEAVFHKKNGLLSDPNDFDEFKNNVQTLVCNRDLIIKYGEKSVDEVMKNFTIESGVKKLSSYYFDILCNSMAAT